MLKFYGKNSFTIQITATYSKPTKDYNIPKKNWILWDLEDEIGIHHSMMMKIVETWSEGVADRLNLAVITDEKTIKLLKEWDKKQ